MNPRVERSAARVACYDHMGAKSVMVYSIQEEFFTDLCPL